MLQYINMFPAIGISLRLLSCLCLKKYRWYASICDFAGAFFPLKVCKLKKDNIKISNAPISQNVPFVQVYHWVSRFLQKMHDHDVQNWWADDFVRAVLLCCTDSSEARRARRTLYIDKITNMNTQHPSVRVLSWDNLPLGDDTAPLGAVSSSK